jgi:hypothetical protein
MTTHARRALDVAFRLYGFDAVYTAPEAQAAAGTVRLLPVPQDMADATASFMTTRIVTGSIQFRVRIYEPALEDAVLAEKGELVTPAILGSGLEPFAGKTFVIDGEPKSLDLYRLTRTIAVHDAARFGPPQA